MESCIIRNNEAIYAIYKEKSTIRIRKRNEDKWNEAIITAKNTIGGFSVMGSPDGEPAILYQDSKGNLMAARGDRPHRMVLRNTSENASPLHIRGILRENTIQLFYNRDYISESYITEQHRREDGSWSKAIPLDKYISNGNLTKLVCMGDNYILFYSKNVPEQQIGYREIGRYSIGEFKMLYSTGYKILDYSIALTCDEIHFCAVVLTNRGNRLIYIKKDGNGISKAKILYEGFAKGCHISIENSKIVIVFSTISGNNRIMSYDMGNTFRRTESIEQFVFNKTLFYDYIKQSSDNFVASELITDVNFPYEVRYCPFINNSFNEVEKLKREIERLKRVAKG